MVPGNTRFISSVEHHDILTKSTLNRLTTGGPRVVKCRVEQIRYYNRRKNSMFSLVDLIVLHCRAFSGRLRHCMKSIIILIFNLITYIEQKSIQIS